MRFHKDIGRIPYNTPLMLRHHSYGIGIGCVRKEVNSSLFVSYAGMTKTLTHLGATMPSPVEIADITGWAHFVDDKPLEEYSATLPLALAIRNAARHSSVYDREEGMTLALDTIANLADELIDKTVTS
jgi:hypothetical protein